MNIALKIPHLMLNNNQSIYTMVSPLLQGHIICNGENGLIREVDTLDGTSLPTLNYYLTTFKTWPDNLVGGAL